MRRQKLRLACTTEGSHDPRKRCRPRPSIDQEADKPIVLPTEVRLVCVGVQLVRLRRRRVIQSLFPAKPTRVRPNDSGGPEGEAGGPEGLVLEYALELQATPPSSSHHPEHPPRQPRLS